MHQERQLPSQEVIKMTPLSDSPTIDQLKNFHAIADDVLRQTSGSREEKRKSVINIVKQAFPGISDDDALKKINEILVPVGKFKKFEDGTYSAKYGKPTFEDYKTNEGEYIKMSGIADAFDKAGLDAAKVRFANNLNEDEFNRRYGAGNGKELLISEMSQADKFSYGSLERAISKGMLSPQEVGELLTQKIDRDGIYNISPEVARYAIQDEKTKSTILNLVNNMAQYVADDTARKEIIAASQSGEGATRMMGGLSNKANKIISAYEIINGLKLKKSDLTKYSNLDVSNNPVLFELYSAFNQINANINVLLDKGVDLSHQLLSGNENYITEMVARGQINKDSLLRAIRAETQKQLHSSSDFVGIKKLITALFKKGLVSDEEINSVFDARTYDKKAN